MCWINKQNTNVQRIPVLQISSNGESKLQNISIEEILEKGNRKFHLRDLRLLSKVESSKLCAILPRPQAACYILEIESIRLICWQDSCILLQNNSILHHQFCQHITNSLAGGAKKTPDLYSVLKIYQTSSENVEFGHKVLESALAVTVAKFEGYIRILKPAVDLLLQQIAADPKSSSLRRMLAVKKSLGDFELNVNNVSRILQGLLSNDEDLVGLYLSNQDRRVDQHEEVELLLESYLADLEDIQTTIRNLKESIEDTNQFIGAHLDALRNKMIRMGLFMEMGTLCLGSGALVAGVFGMNLTHGLESHPYAFYVTCTGVSIIMLSTFAKFRQHYRALWADTSNAHSFKVLKNFLTYVDQLEELVTKDKMEITEKEFKQALDKITGDKVPAEEAEFIFRMFDKNKDRMINRNTELNIPSTDHKQ